MPPVAVEGLGGTEELNDDGGPIVPITAEEVGRASAGATSPPSPSATKPLSPSESAASAQNKAEFFVIVESEAKDNPHFAEARQVDIRRLREMDAEALI